MTEGAAAEENAAKKAIMKKKQLTEALVQTVFMILKKTEPSDLTCLEVFQIS